MSDSADLVLLARGHVQWLQSEPLLNIFHAGLAEIWIYLSRKHNSFWHQKNLGDLADLAPSHDSCFLDRNIHILPSPAWNMLSKGLDWSHWMCPSDSSAESDILLYWDDCTHLGSTTNFQGVLKVCIRWYWMVVGPGMHITMHLWIKVSELVLPNLMFYFTNIAAHIQICSFHV